MALRRDVGPGDTAGYWLALMLANLKASLARPGTALVLAGFMLGNNLTFFVIWLVYFANFSGLRGWHLEDVAVLIGMLAWAFGLAMLLAAGMRDLPRAIVDGGLDVHLGRPRHPLPSLLMSRSIPSGFGDLLSALIFWLVFGGRGLDDLPLLLLLATAAAVVVVATTTLVNCIVFWLPSAAAACEEVFQLFMTVSSYPQHPFGFTVRLLLFTLFPTAFVTLLPVEAVREGSVWKALAVVAAAVVYSGLAVAVFNRGLRHYASGNRILEIR